MAETTILEFDLELNRIPVKLKIKGAIVEAFLQELTGEERDKYLDGMTKNMRMKNGKIDTLVTFDGLQTRLVSQCLYREDTGAQFSEGEIKKFPSKVVEGLYQAASSLSGLDREEAVEAKND